MSSLADLTRHTPHHLQVVAVNDPFITGDYMAYMFKYDSVHGKYVGTVEGDEEGLYIDNKKVRTRASCVVRIGTPTARRAWLGASSLYEMRWRLCSHRGEYRSSWLEAKRG
jgi:hypothetical protein